MKAIVAYSTILIFLTITNLMFVSGTNFDPKTMRLLNYKYSSSEPTRINAVFRSNIPISDGEYSYDRVATAMKDTAMKDAKIILPIEDFYLIDLSLLQSSDNLLQIEREYFEKNPTKGELYSFPVKGEKNSPSGYSETEIRAQVKNLSWMRDDLNNITNQIEHWLNDFSGDRNVFVLIHCQHGHDRAGQVSSSYWLAHGHHNWEQVQGTNYRINNYSPIAYNNQNALLWYCHHLQYERNYTHLTCTHENLKSTKEVRPKLVDWDSDKYLTASEYTGYVVSVSVVSSLCGVLLVVCLILFVSLCIIIFKRRKYFALVKPAENTTAL